MKNITEVVDSIINELDGRKGFEFGDLDEDILDEIKDELAKLILPVVVNQRELLIKEISNWLMKSTTLSVEAIVELEHKFKQ